MNKYNAITRIRRLVNEHFDGSKVKINYWFVTKNPSFGNISPVTMMAMGRESEVLKMVEAMIGENGNG